MRLSGCQIRLSFLWPGRLWAAKQVLRTPSVGHCNLVLQRFDPAAAEVNVGEWSESAPGGSNSHGARPYEREFGRRSAPSAGVGASLATVLSRTSSVGGQCLLAEG